MRLLTAFLTFGIYVGTLMLFAVMWVCADFSRSLPSYQQLTNYEPPMVSRFHAGDGRLLAELATEKRVFISYESMPPLVYQAFVSAEDQHFFQHFGIDPIGITRAMVFNVIKKVQGRRMHGASTITQQVAKNFLLTNEVSYERKIKEALISLRMERAFSKQKILELYLNEIFLGRRSYGIGAAALNYFDKSLDELSLAEIAYLAALPKGPNNYDPIRHKEQAIARRNYVIGRMEEDGYITAQQAAQAYKEDLIVRPRDIGSYVDAPYFSEEVRREILNEQGEKFLYEGGISVRTTVDPRLQDIAQRALQKGLQLYDRRHGWRGPVRHLKSLQNWQQVLQNETSPEGSGHWHLAVVVNVQKDYAEVGFVNGGIGKIPLAEVLWARAWQKKERLGPQIKKVSDVLTKGDIVLVEPMNKDEKGQEYPKYTYGLRQVPAVNGALVAMDPHTGRVLALVGGYDYASSVFNRATQAKRQSGSSIKPFVYLAALDHGYTPSTLVLDEPFTVDQGQDKSAWTPGNYTDRYYGPTTLRVGLEKSRNVMTARLAYQLGPKMISQYAARFGIDDHMPELLSMALGAGETTALRMTTAYAMLVNGGKKITPTLIDRIQDRSGKTIFTHDRRSCAQCKNVQWHKGLSVPELPDLRVPIADPRTSYQIVSMLTGVVQRGTGRSLKTLGFPLAGKTGTTSNERDAWFVGFTPDLTVGVYVGFDNPRPMGHHEGGGTTAAPVFKAFMEEAVKPEDVPPFRIPRGLRLINVNPATGLPAPASRKTILEAFIPGTEPGAGKAHEINLQDIKLNAVSEKSPTISATPSLTVDLSEQPSLSLGERHPSLSIEEAAPAYGETRETSEMPAPVYSDRFKKGATGVQATGTGGLY